VDGASGAGKQHLLRLESRLPDAATVDYLLGTLLMWPEIKFAHPLDGVGL
jgi:hypothetical protein